MTSSPSTLSSLLDLHGVLRAKRTYAEQQRERNTSTTTMSSLGVNDEGFYEDASEQQLQRVVRLAVDATRNARKAHRVRLNHNGVHSLHQDHGDANDNNNNNNNARPPPPNLSLTLPFKVGDDDVVEWLDVDNTTNNNDDDVDVNDVEAKQKQKQKVQPQSDDSDLRTRARLLAVAAQNRVRLHVVASVRGERDFANRARTLARDALTQLQRRERARQETMRRKKLEERATARAREEEEERLRQQRKLNFLLTQTELYTHFVANKHAPPPVAASSGATLDPDAVAAAQRAAETRVAEIRVYDDLAAQAHAADAADGGAAAVPPPTAASTTGATPSGGGPVAKVQFNEVDARIVAETQQPSLFLGGLKSYQQKGLAWLANLFDQSINGILADEMGLGKTIQSIALLAHLAEKRNVWGPFLVVAPSSTLHNWYQEVTKFCPSFTVRPYWGNKQQREVLRRSWKQSALGRKNSPWHVVVTSYQLIVQDEKFFTRLKWQYMVMDEAHFLKNSSSARWKVLLSFKCRNRLLLTGTPIQNNMAELWALLHFIMPTLFDSHAEFADWFSKDIESHATGLNAKLNEHQLHRLHMILKPFMLRRVKRDVENEMARKIEKEIYCELTSHQRRLYRMVRGDFSRSKFRDVSRAKLHMGQLMNVLMHLRKVCNHPSLFENETSISPFACTTATVHNNADLLPGSVLATRGDSILSRSLPAYAAVTLDAWQTVADVVESDYSPPVVAVADGAHFVNAPIVAGDRVATTLRSSSVLARFGSNLPLRERLCVPRNVALLGPMAVWRPDVTSRRSSAVHACLRVAGVSSGEAWFHSVAPSLDRWLALLGNDAPKSAAPHVRTSVFVASEQSPSDVTRSLALELLDTSSGLLEMASAYTARVVATPAHITFVDNEDSHLRALRTRVFASEIRSTRLAHGLCDSSRAAAWSEHHSDALCAEVGSSVVSHVAPMDAVGGFWHSTSGAQVRPRSFDDAIMASGKLLALDRLLTQLKREGHRVLLYSQMTKMLDVLEDFMAHRRHRYVRLDGSSRLEDRRDLVNDWQSNDELFVFLLSTRAGGIGINLTAADTVVFYDGDWNPTMDEQAMDRTHRLGQTKQVTVYRLLAAGTIEERIMRRARQKQRIHSLVIKGSDLSSGNHGEDAAQSTSMYGGTDVIADAGPDELDTNEVLSLLLDDDENMAAAQRSSSKRARAQSTASEKKPKIEVLAASTTTTNANAAVAATTDMQ